MMRRLAPFVLFTLALIATPTALAAFPGANGRLVVRRVERGSLRQEPIPTPTPTPSAANTASGLYAIDTDGGRPVRLTDTPYSSEPSFAADGRFLVYGGGGKVCFVAEAVFAPRCLDWGNVNGATFSPDGTQLTYYTADISPRVYVANADGTDRRLLAGDHFALDPAWSPDGAHIVFSGSSASGQPGVDLYTVAPDGSDLTRITDTPAVEERNEDWAPDGSRIVYEAGNDVRSIAASGTDDRLLGQGSDPAYAPDGTRVAVVDGGHVATLSALGGDRRAVTSDDRFVETNVTWGRVPDAIPAPSAAPTPTPTATAAVRRRSTWKRPTHARVTRRSRTVRIRFRLPRCGVLQRIKVKRIRRAVVITVAFRVPVDDRYAIPSCPRPRTRTRAVPIGERLGRRAVRDGSKSPARRRYRAP